MTAQLVFVHGRAQENKDSIALKQEWIAAWSEGLAKSGKDLPVQETSIRFPYYGQTLFDIVAGADQIAEVIVRGSRDTDELSFMQAVLTEVQEAKGVADEQVEEALGTEVVQRGPLNWEWLQGILKAVDRHVPGASGASIALATKDVYQYLRNPGIRDAIETGVRKAFAQGRPTIVVAHSLGTVVAFNLLRREGAANGWNVPLLVTLGSPLGIKAIRTSLSPIEHPSCVRRWHNAADPRDVVALRPLDKTYFAVDPAIEDRRDIHNKTSNRHGISGYLDDERVASLIHDALKGS